MQQQRDAAPQLNPIALVRWDVQFYTNLLLGGLSAASGLALWSFGLSNRMILTVLGACIGGAQVGRKGYLGGLIVGLHGG